VFGAGIPTVSSELQRTGPAVVLLKDEHRNGNQRVQRDVHMSSIWKSVLAIAANSLVPRKSMPSWVNQWITLLAEPVWFIAQIATRPYEQKILLFNAVES